MSEVNGTVEPNVYEGKTCEPLRIVLDNDKEFWEYIAAHKDDKVMVEFVNRESGLIKARLLI